MRRCVFAAVGDQLDAMLGDLLEATVELAQLALARGAMKAAEEHDHHEALGRLLKPRMSVLPGATRFEDG